MESRIIVREKAVIPWFRRFPFEETEKWEGAEDMLGELKSIQE
jgi:hypothetical protein